MLLTLWRRLFGKPVCPPRADLFDPEERLIYEHLCGFDAKGNKLYARKDPMILWQKVMDQMGMIDADAKVAKSPSKGAAARYASLIGRLRSIFEVKPLDQFGLSDPLVLQLFTHFMEYSQGVKKNGPPLPQSAAATSPGTPTTPDNGAATQEGTSPISDSGSTATGTSTASPTPSVSELASPSAK